MEAKYRRVVLKLSGEALAGDQGFGINPAVVEDIATQIKRVRDHGIDVAIVVGLGYLCCAQTCADYMGMMATVMNALALQDALENQDVDTRVQSAIEMRQVAEPYIRRRAIRHMEKGRVVIFGAGTGNPYFSTDTTAALRAAEIEADVILMAKKGTDGIYDADPNKNPDAKRFETLSYIDILQKGLAVMDATATSLCMENKIPIVVFNIDDHANIARASFGEPIGTTVGGEAV